MNYALPIKSLVSSFYSILPSGNLIKLLNIIEHGPFKDDLPIIRGDLS